jgi:fermentation-respiration switch protein FrsA (DUF1100 family)
VAPLRNEDAPNKELEIAWEYYPAPRCIFSTAPDFAAARGLNQIITYDAFNMAESFLRQPLQIVAGSVAGSKWMSDDLYRRAASTRKNLHVVAGANHMSLYNVPKYVDEAVSGIGAFLPGQSLSATRVLCCSPVPSQASMRCSSKLALC